MSTTVQLGTLPGLVSAGSAASAPIRSRVDLLFATAERKNFERVHRVFVWLIPAEWTFALILAGTLSLRHGLGSVSLYEAALGGALFALPCLALIVWRPVDLSTRLAVALAQAGFSGLFIHLSGHHTEAYFHVFGALAFLALYRDWRVIATATAAFASQHLILQLFWPQLTADAFAATPWRTVEFSFWLLFENLALFGWCWVSRREMREICARQHEYRLLLGQLETRVYDRTRALENEIAARKRAARELDLLHNQLLVASRQAGMAEVATGVLHNVGNVLTSVNLIVHDVQDRLKATRLAHLHRVVEVLAREQPRLVEFLTADGAGRQLPDFLKQLDDYLVAENRQLLVDVGGLIRHFEHIREIIVTQQSSAQLLGVTETLAPAQLFEDALHLNAESLERHGISLERLFTPCPAIKADRHKVLQILVNLIKNAKDALQVRKPGDRLILVRVAPVGPQSVALSVQDNGQGIAEGDLLRIFQHGFTTKPGGHGFGLHSSVLAAREMGGDLTVASPGPAAGATFTLTLPVS